MSNEEKTGQVKTIFYGPTASLIQLLRVDKFNYISGGGMEKDNKTGEIGHWNLL